MAQPTFTLALSGGAALGWAHIGVLQALRDMGLHPAGVAGISMGAFVGAAYCGGALEAVAEAVQDLSLLDVARMSDLSFARGGLVDQSAYVEELMQHVFAERIEELEIAFAAGTVDIATGDAVGLREGPLLEAVSASIAIPGLFFPVERGGRLLIDGGWANPVPVALARELAPGPVIAVDVLQDFPARAADAGCAPGKKTNPGMAAAAQLGQHLLFAQLARAGRALERPDLTILPALGTYEPLEFDKAGEVIPLGRAAVESRAADIRALLG